MNVKACSSAQAMISGDGLGEKAFKLNTVFPSQPINCAVYHYLSKWPVLFSFSNDDAQWAWVGDNKKKLKNSVFLSQPLLLAHWQLSTNEILSCPLGSILNASIEFFKWSLVLFQELKKTYWSLVFCSWLTEVFKCTLVFSCVPLTRNPWQSVQSFEYNIFFYILYRAQLYNLLQLYSDFLGTQSALHSKGDISSSTTSVQHPPGWCDGSHSAPERPPQTSLLVERRQSDEASRYGDY